MIEYSLKTDPPEAMYWSTYRLKKSHIVIHHTMSRSEKADWRSKILKSITYDEEVSSVDSGSRNHARKVG